MLRNNNKIDVKKHHFLKPVPLKVHTYHSLIEIAFSSGPMAPSEYFYHRDNLSYYRTQLYSTWYI